MGLGFAKCCNFGAMTFLHSRRFGEPTSPQIIQIGLLTIWLSMVRDIVPLPVFKLPLRGEGSVMPTLTFPEATLCTLSPAKSDQLVKARVRSDCVSQFVNARVSVGQDLFPRFCLSGTQCMARPGSSESRPFGHTFLEMSKLWRHDALQFQLFQCANIAS